MGSVNSITIKVSACLIISVVTICGQKANADGLSIREACGKIVNATNADNGKSHLQGLIRSRLVDYTYFSGEPGKDKINGKKLAPDDILYTAKSGFTLNPGCKEIKADKENNGPKIIQRGLWHPIGLIVKPMGVLETSSGKKYVLVVDEYRLAYYIPEEKLKILNRDLTYVFRKVPKPSLTAEKFVRDGRKHKIHFRDGYGVFETNKYNDKLDDNGRVVQCPDDKAQRYIEIKLHSYSFSEDKKGKTVAKPRKPMQRSMDPCASLNKDNKRTLYPDDGFLYVNYHKVKQRIQSDEYYITYALHPALMGKLQDKNSALQYICNNNVPQQTYSTIGEQYKLTKNKKNDYELNLAVSNHNNAHTNSGIMFSIIGRGHSETPADGGQVNDPSPIYEIAHIITCGKNQDLQPTNLYISVNKYLDKVIKKYLVIQTDEVIDHAKKLVHSSTQCEKSVAEKNTDIDTKLGLGKLWAMRGGCQYFPWERAINSDVYKNIASFGLDSDERKNLSGLLARQIMQMIFYGFDTK